MTTRLIPRHEAVRAVADAVADRTSFVVLVPPALMRAVARSLSGIPRWRALVDNGTETVLSTNLPGLLPMSGLLSPTSGVLLIPKTVSARRIGRAFGQHVPADGSRDLLHLTEPGGRSTGYPGLFVAALDSVDPTSAAAIRAAAVA